VKLWKYQNQPHLETSTCFAGSEDVEFEQFPMKTALIAHEQAKDKELQKKIRESRRDYTMMKVEDYNLLSYQGQIPDSLEGRIIAWYHKYLAHPGMTRMEVTLRSANVWSREQEQIMRHIGKCKECQIINKGSTKKYGQLPPKDMEAPEPWNRINIDLIGPWTVKTPSQRQPRVRGTDYHQPSNRMVRNERNHQTHCAQQHRGSLGRQPPGSAGTLVPKLLGMTEVANSKEFC
jgi:Integrase zinc binding domain